MKGVHFAFVGENAASSSASDSLSLLKRHFIQSGLKYVSNVEGGYETIHSIVTSPQHTLELADHDPNRCVECIKSLTAPNIKSSSHNQKQSFKSSVTGFLSLLGRKMEKFADSMISDDIKQSPRGNTSSSATGVSMTEKEKTAERKRNWQASHIPDTAIPLPPSNSLHALHTIIRNRDVSGKRFVNALNRLTGILVATVLDQRIETAERSVLTSAGGSFTGITTTPVFALSLSRPAAENALLRALSPYHPIIHAEIGKFVVTTTVPAASPSPPPKASPSQPPQRPATTDSKASSSSNTDSDVLSFKSVADFVSAPSTPQPPPHASKSNASSATTAANATANGTVKDEGSGGGGSAVIAFPADIAQRFVILFQPIVTPQNLPELAACMEETIRMGVKPSRVCVMAIVAARPALWTLCERFKGCWVVTTAVDEYKPAGKGVPLLLPGLAPIESRAAVMDTSSFSSSAVAVKPSAASVSSSSASTTATLAPPRTAASTSSADD